MSKDNKVCSFDPCDKKAHAKGYCAGHYTQQYKGQEMTELGLKKEPRQKAKCKFEGCDNDVSAIGLCSSHSSQWYKNGELKPLRVRGLGSASTCSFDTCERVTYSRELCRSHYQQKYIKKQEVRELRPKGILLKDKFPEIFAKINVEKTLEANPGLNIDGLFVKTAHKMIWFNCEKHPDYPYVSLTANVVNGIGCGICNGDQLCPEYNSLKAVRPDILKEWADTNTIDPSQIYHQSTQKADWICSLEHTWTTRIQYRTDPSRGTNCPYCAGTRVILGENDLATTHPDIAGEWHPTKNKDFTPQDIKADSNKKAWWQCKDGHEWYANIQNRTRMFCGCVKCSGWGTSKIEGILRERLREEGTITITNEGPEQFRGMVFPASGRKMTVDITGYCESLGKWVCIEYDGPYHKKEDTRRRDIVKSQMLLGHEDVVVIRVRIDKLESLHIEHERYKEIEHPKSQYKKQMDILIEDIVAAIEDFKED